MKLTPPSMVAFTAGVALLVIGTLLHIDVLNLPVLAPHAFWITLAGGIVLAAGASMRGV